MVAKKLQIHSVKITGKYNYDMPPSKTLPKVFIITTPGRRKLLISFKQSFLKICFPLAERGRTMELKI